MSGISRFFRSVIGASSAPNRTPPQSARPSRGVKLGDEAPARLNEKPTLLTSAHGIPIPAVLADYVTLIAQGGTVIVYVSQGAHQPTALDSLLRALHRRPEFKRIEQRSVTPAQLASLRSQYVTNAYQAGEGERRVASMVRKALALGATDIHLKPTRDSAHIQLRINGDITIWREDISKKTLADFLQTLWTMSDASSKKGDYGPKISGSTSIIANLVRYGLDDVLASVRCSFASTFLGGECSLRLQEAGQTARPLLSLGLSEHPLQALTKALHARDGAIFISGPLGSGKSNLLASATLYYHVLFPGKRVVTLEHPVEIFIHDDVSQWEISGQGTDWKQEFRDRLEQAVRADEQLLVVQECRDSSTATIFLEAAITGALAMSTVHSPTASGIIPRLRGWHIDEVTLTSRSTMRLFGAVRLVPVLCEHCKRKIADVLAEERITPTKVKLSARLEVLKEFAEAAFALRGEIAPDLTRGYVRNHEGCPECQDTNAEIIRAYGVKGRAQLAEMVRPTKRYLKMLYDGQEREAELYLRQVLKVPSLREDALLRIAAGSLCPLDAEIYLGEFDESDLDYDAEEFDPPVSRLEVGGV